MLDQTKQSDEKVIYEESQEQVSMHNASSKEEGEKINKEYDKEKQKIMEKVRKDSLSEDINESSDIDKYDNWVIERKLEMEALKAKRMKYNDEQI